jgi:hypothetical protein
MRRFTAGARTTIAYLSHRCCRSKRHHVVCSQNRVAADRTGSLRVSGDEKTEEACGGCGQGHPGKAKAEEEDLARELGCACTPFSKRATTTGTAAAGLSRQAQRAPGAPRPALQFLPAQRHPHS